MKPVLGDVLDAGKSVIIWVRNAWMLRGVSHLNRFSGDSKIVKFDGISQKESVDGRDPVLVVKSDFSIWIVYVHLQQLNVA